MPTSRLRRIGYQQVMGYDVHPSARIGLLAVLTVDEAVLEKGAKIGRGSHFVGPFALHMGAGARVGPGNTFACATFATEPARVGFERKCYLGDDTLVTADHYVDVSGGFELGARAWLAGRGTQVWTHGAGQGGVAVRIGEDTYVGAASRFAPGADVGERCLVALGSVVTSRFGDEQVLAGVPARVVKKNTKPD